MTRRKTIWTALVLALALLFVCAGCGGGNDQPKENEPAATEEPAPTELPSVTAPPAVSNGDDNGMVEAENNNAPQQSSREDWLASLSEEQRKAEELVGESVEELFAAIGQPIRSIYSVSCLVDNGEDGLLYYDGFTVSTTRWPDGTELVQGTVSN